MNLQRLFPLLLLAAGCATMQQVQRNYEDANSAISPNFDKQKVYTLAVMPPQVGTPDDAAHIEGLRDFAGMAMIQTGRFSEVERTRIDIALKEQEFGASGLVDASSAAKLGKFLGADAVLLTNVVYTKHDPFFSDSPEQRETELNVRIISSSTAEVLYRGRGQGTSFNGELEAWQAAFQVAVGMLKRAGGMQ